MFVLILSLMNCAAKLNFGRLKVTSIYTVSVQSTERLANVVLNTLSEAPPTKRYRKK